MVLSNTLTSIQNALEYSTMPTEIMLVLNEQTFIDTPLEGEPKDMWKHFMDHPLIEKCKLVHVTDDDPFMGIAKCRRDFRSPDGLTYWGESDCLIPLETFYIAESFYKQHTERPYVMTFSVRKMWPGWELIEHSSVANITLEDLSKDDPEQAFLRCDGPMTLEKLYDFNEKQGDPEIIKLPRPRIEGAMTILTENMPEPLIAPDIDFYHEDYCLEQVMPYYNIPQYHVSNVLKGHDHHNPNKRTNLEAKKQMGNKAKERKQMCMENMTRFVQELYQGKLR